MKPMPLLLLLPLLVASPQALQAAGGFRDGFASDIPRDPQARAGWAAFTGDGEAELSLAAEDGHAVMTVDARSDRRGIWWAVIKRSVSPFVDRQALARPDRELRVEARVRSHVAPRRINLSFNHSRTTDFHANLAEYDLGDTDWHVISLTTHGFDARPEDEIFVQLAMIDWGIDLFRLDVDYVKVEVVDPAAAGPDLGNPLPYRPSLPPLASFDRQIPAAEDAVIDSAWPEVNFGRWAAMGAGAPEPALTLGGSRIVILRWDLSAFRGRTPAGWGALALTTRNVQWAATDLEEFGYLRVAEILDGDPAWERDTVTRESFLAGRAPSQAIGQMIVDVQPSFEPGSRTVVPISPPVLERLISGRSRGLAIYAQGAVDATFVSGKADESAGPVLYFDLE